VEILPVYELASPAAARGQLRRLFDREPVDVVTFTSSATALNFAAAFEGPEHIQRALQRTSVACMGPVTADTARGCGMRVDIIAEEYTTRGLAHAIAARFNS
jgi:uroporphyrinogen III methyltransferase/synthase